MIHGVCFRSWRCVGHCSGAASPIRTGQRDGPCWRSQRPTCLGSRRSGAYGRPRGAGHSRGESSPVPLRTCVRTASAGAGTRFPGAIQETLLARLGNPRCVHLVRGSCRHLARVFLALVNRAGKKQRSRQVHLARCPDKNPASPARTRPLRQYS